MALAEKLFPKPHSKLSGSYANLGRLYLNQGRLAEAEPLLRRAVEVSEAAGDATTHDHAWRLTTLSLLDLEAERFEDAAARLEQAVALAETTLGPAHRRTLSIRLALASARAELRADAPLLADVEQLLRDIGSAPTRIDALLLAARLQAQQGQATNAAQTLEEARVLNAASKPASPDLAPRRALEARALLALGQREAARSAFLDAASDFESSGRASHPGRGRSLLQAALLLPVDDPERARLAAAARSILLEKLKPPAPSLTLLDKR